MGKPKLSTSATSRNVDKSESKLVDPKFAGLRPFKKGERSPHQGRGPAKGAPNAGRPRNEWKAALAAMVTKDQVLAHLETALDAGPSHPFFKDALAYCTDHSQGKAMQSVDVTSAGEKLGAVLVNGAPLGTQAE